MVAEAKTYDGGCHCGKVRYRVVTDPAEAIACNCSRCAKHGLWLTFATPEKFTLLSGEDDLVDYLFNRRVIHHFFCRDCGVESFARAKTKDGREMFAVNIRCLDGIDTSALSPKPFDGKSL
ncbi:MAG TPA: GFA family protein [Aestuariivirgaceae bacterium]|jgi:hypothetical protein|nr:GFA family protein [Aestuariivirgaceae bacterium]